ncbi:hypothetical protein FOL47_007852 [Perkinsus chesapeaki]|uniref:DDHD domain-containing protein n=1 Tax=Perkinsus chesapeaki TaxID=330153 RepID=A0A7J6MV54_PERCH|nr:hypothetical protein FOL47_007852 [Perkinsus chesapeaki]
MESSVRGICRRNMSSGGKAAATATMYLDKPDTTGGFMTSRRRQKMAEDIVKERDRRRLKGMPVRDFGSMNPSDLCGAFSAAARNKVSDVKIWRSLQNRALFLMNIMAPANVAAVMNSLARAKLISGDDLSEDLIAAVTEKVIESGGDSFQWNDLGLLVNAYARLKVNDDRFFKACSDIVIKCKGDGMTEKDIARYVNGYAKMGIRDKELFTVIADKIIDCESTFTELSISNIAHGYGKLDIKDINVYVIFKVIGRELDGRLLSDGMKAQHVANIIHAFAKLQIWDAPVIWDRLVRRLLPKMLAANEFSPLEVSAIAGALSKAVASPVNSSTESQVDCRSTLPPMATSVLNNIKQYQPHEIANVLHAFSTIHQHIITPYCHSESELWSEAVPELLIDKDHLFDNQSVSMILCAFGRVGRALPRRAMSVIEGKLLQYATTTTIVGAGRTSCCDTPNMINQLYALSRLGLSSSPLVPAICEAIIKAPPVKEDSLLVNTFYALSKLVSPEEIENDSPQMLLLKRVINQLSFDSNTAIDAVTTSTHQFSSPQHISNILHASCDLSPILPTSTFPYIIASRIPDNWEAFTPQLFASALVSCAKMKLSSDELWYKLNEASKQMMVHSDCRSDCDIIVALSSMNKTDSVLWEAAVTKHIFHIKELPLSVLTSFLYCISYTGYSNSEYLTQLSSEILRRSRNIPLHLIDAIGSLMSRCIPMSTLSSSIAPWDVVDVKANTEALVNPLHGAVLSAYFEVPLNESLTGSGNAFSYLLRLLQSKSQQLIDNKDELLTMLERWNKVNESDFMEPLVYAMEKMIIDHPIDYVTIAKASMYMGPGQRRGLSRATERALEDIRALPATAVVACSAILIQKVDITSRARIIDTLPKYISADGIKPIIRLCRTIADLHPPIDSSISGAIALGRALQYIVNTSSLPSPSPAIVCASIMLTGTVHFKNEVDIQFDDVGDVCRMLETLCKVALPEPRSQNDSYEQQQQQLNTQFLLKSCLSYIPSTPTIINDDFSIPSRYLRAVGETLSRFTSKDIITATSDMSVLQEVMQRKSPPIFCSISALLYAVARFDNVSFKDGLAYETLSTHIIELLDRLSRYKSHLSSEADARMLKRCVHGLKLDHSEWYRNNISPSVRSSLDTIRIIVPLRVVIDFQPYEVEEQNTAGPCEQTRDEDDWMNEYLMKQELNAIVVGYKKELHPLPSTDKSKNKSEEQCSDNNDDTCSVGKDTRSYDNYSHTHMTAYGGPVDHIILVVHGIGPGDEHLNNNLDMMRETFEFVRLHWFWSMKVDCHIEMINWKKHVRESQKRMFEKITPARLSGGEQYHDTRMLLNVATADIIYYITPDKRQIILDTVTKLLNDTVSRLQSSHPQRYANSRVSLVGHSLGSVILYDILKEAANPLKFEVDRFFLWGSPLAVFLSINNSTEQNDESSLTPQTIFHLPNRLPIYNVFHPHDPVAFRLDPLVSLDYPKESLVLPHWQNNELRSFTHMRPVTVINRSNRKPKRDANPSRQNMRRSWMEAMFRTSTEDEEVTSSHSDIAGSSGTVGRVDYALQESTTEGIVHSVHRMSIISAHSCYWNSRDLATFMLKVLAGVHPIAPLYIDDDISTP